MRNSTTRGRGQALLALTVGAALLVGCLPGAAAVPAPAAAYQAVSPAARRVGDRIPVPQDETVLTLSGAIATTNEGAELRLDLATIDQFGLVQYTVVDPWQDRSMKFSGVLLADLLKYAGVAPSATTLHLVALDDYQADISLEDVRKWPILLATRVDDLRPAVVDGGPTRIVFPYHAFPQIDTRVYNGQWVWSVKTIDVK